MLQKAEKADSEVHPGSRRNPRNSSWMASHKRLLPAHESACRGCHHGLSPVLSSFHLDSADLVVRSQHVSSKRESSSVMLCEAQRPACPACVFGLLLSCQVVVLILQASNRSRGELLTLAPAMHEGSPSSTATSFAPLCWNVRRIRSRGPTLAQHSGLGLRKTC